MVIGSSPCCNHHQNRCGYSLELFSVLAEEEEAVVFFHGKAPSIPFPASKLSIWSTIMNKNGS